MPRVERFEARRRAGETMRGVSRARLKEDLHRDALALHERDVPTYGLLLGPWVGGFTTAETRMRFLVGNVLQRALWLHGRNWKLEVEEGDHRTPIAALMDDGERAHAVPIVMSPRTVRIGGTLILLSQPTAGAKILEALTNELAAHFSASRQPKRAA